MATYTIRILNNSGVEKSYVAFMGLPRVRSSGADPVIHANAWATFENLANGSWDTVTCTDTTYAYWSAGPGASKSKDQALAGGAITANTDARDSVMFVAVTRPNSASDGAFQIIAGGDFGLEDGHVFGLARSTGAPTPTPVATFPALPNTTFDITPVETFYVAEINYAPGQVTPPLDAFEVYATIDFTGLPYTTTTATHDAHGNWSVSYD